MPIEDVGGVVIDEVSFNELRIFGQADGRFRQLLGQPDVIFGGVPLMLAGDNFQKPPPAGTPWYRSLVEVAAKSGDDPSPPSMHIAFLIASATRLDHSTQHSHHCSMTVHVLSRVR